MKYTKIPSDTFSEIQLNAGILVSGSEGFTPATGTVTDANILGATSGGVNFADAVTYKDFGEDIDNCPKNLMELKRIESREIKISGTFVTVNPDLVKSLIGAASTATTKITPTDTLATSHFQDLWWIGDYSNVNEDSGSSGKAGFVAIHMMNCLSTGGLSIQSGDKSKGQFAFEYTAHYTNSAQTTVPYEVYVSAGNAG